MRMRSLGAWVAAFAIIVTCPALSQTQIDLPGYFKNKIGLTDSQISSLRSGQPVSKALTPRSPAEIFVFGAVYIDALPEAFVKYANDINRLRKAPGFLAVNKLSNPPRKSDLAGFEFNGDDVKALRECKPSDCDVQLPGATIEAFRSSINWSAPDVNQLVNQFAQNLVLARIPVYQKDGNRTLGVVYNDKEQQVNVNEQFKFVLSSDALLPLPEFYNYLQNYPAGKPPATTDYIYWSNVKFGLKPTLRIVHVLTMHGTKPTEPAAVVAEKQLYSSHYFETALDISYCVRASNDPKKPGFYLIQVMGSEQAGLTGFKGSIIRRAAVSHSVSGLQKSLSVIKSALELR